MDRIESIDVRSSALDGAAFEVVSLDARERIFETYEIAIALRSEDPLPIRELLGQRVSIQMVSTRGRERHWHGIVWSGRSKPRAQGDHLVDLTIAPRLRRLKLGKDSRVFRDKNVPAVIEDVLRGAGLPGDAWTWQMTEALPVHGDIVQYRESDFDLVRRLLIEEGMAFAIYNDASDEKIVFFDSARGHERTPVVDVLRYVHETGHELDSIHAIRERSITTPSATALRDWDLAQPDAPRSAHSEHESRREVYLHPGGFVADADGNRRAARYLDGLRHRERVVTARSDVPWLEPGRVFRIEGHERLDLNDDFLVLSVAHRCARSDVELGPFAFENELEAIPAATEYRADPRDARPLAIGLQTAFVTVPGPLEHFSDRFGRMKVRFDWDRSGIVDSESSTWSRVGQMQMPGPIVLPRAAFEVDVACEQGDLDRHLVTGHRYNAEQMPPYPLPASGAISSWQSRTLYGGIGANELRFDDTAGREEMYWFASMNLREIVLHDAVRRVTCHEAVTVGIKQALSVTEDFVSVVGGARTVAVGRNQSLRVDERFSDAVGGDERVTCNRRRLMVGGDLSENVRGDRTSTVGPLHTAAVFGSWTERTLGNATTTAGALWAEIVSGDRISHVRGSRTESIAALKYIEAGTYRIESASDLEDTCSTLESRAGGDRSDHARSNARFRAQGELHATANNVSISATQSLTITAGSCTITLASSGAVTLHAPRVNLRNAGAIGSQVRVN